MGCASPSPLAKGGLMFPTRGSVGLCHGVQPASTSLVEHAHSAGFKPHFFFLCNSVALTVAPLDFMHASRLHHGEATPFSDVKGNQ